MPPKTVALNERVDTRKAAMWAFIAAIALALGTVVAPTDVLRADLLLAVLGFGFLLPPIAILHLRFEGANRNAAVLSTIAGTAVAITGYASMSFGQLEPGALFFLGMWWWVVGKFSVESALLARPFGYATMVLSILAFAAVLANVLGFALSWPVLRLLLAVWLLALGWLLYRGVSRSQDAG